MEAAVLSNETALLLLTLEAKLATTQNNLNDFFITISAILVFGNYFSIELCTLRLFISCINSHASRVFTDGNWIGSFQECHQHLDEKHVGCMWVCFIHDIPVSCFKIFIFYFFVSIVIGATVYWLVGYAFAFGDGNEFIGWTGFALQGVSPSKLSFWFYQTIFANTASTIVRYCGISFMRDFLKRLTHSFFFTYLFVYAAVQQLKESTCLHSSFMPFYWPDSFIRLPVAGSGIHPDGSKSEVLSISAAVVVFTCLVVSVHW